MAWTPSIFIDDRSQYLKEKEEDEEEEKFVQRFIYLNLIFEWHIYGVGTLRKYFRLISIAERCMDLASCTEIRWLIDPMKNLAHSSHILSLDKRTYYKLPIEDENILLSSSLFLLFSLSLPPLAPPPVPPSSAPRL